MEREFVFYYTSVIFIKKIHSKNGKGIGFILPLGYPKNTPKIIENDLINYFLDIYFFGIPKYGTFKRWNVRA